MFQITLRKGYAIPDLKADLSSLYNKTGIKGLGMVFLMTDSQVFHYLYLLNYTWQKCFRYGLFDVSLPIEKKLLQNNGDIYSYKYSNVVINTNWPNF